MGCCKLAQVDVRKWLSHFFTHIHEYDNDYSRDLMELLPHNLKQKGILWHPLKILQDSWLIPRILENPTRFWKYLQYFRRNPAIRGLLMAYEKLVSTNYKWKVLKRKKPPKWWLISSYKIVLQVWSGGLFTDAEFIFPRIKKIKGCITLIIREVEIIFCKNHTSGDRIGTVSLRFYWLFCLRQSKNNS